MFASPTVFVVGAGASADFEIAVGDGLKAKIADLLNFYFSAGQLQRGDPQIAEALNRHAQLANGNSFSWQNVVPKARLISGAMPNAISIDNFIDAHRGDEEVEVCAKIGIVKAILAEESRSKLALLSKEQESFDFGKVATTWLIKFFQMLTENVSRSEVDHVFDNVTLIVFNYDRCIEAFIPAALENYYGISRAEALRISLKLRVVHPYGMVGEVAPDGRLSVPFGSTSTDLLKASRNIRTFCEGVGDESIMAGIREALRTAKTLVFLGFAFHPLNMQILNARTPRLRRIFGTTYGLSKSAVANVEDGILTQFKKLGPRAMPIEIVSNQLDELELENIKAFEFCSQYFRSLSTVRLAA